MKKIINSFLELDMGLVLFGFLTASGTIYIAEQIIYQIEFFYSKLTYNNEFLLAIFLLINAPIYLIYFNTNFEKDIKIGYLMGVAAIILNLILRIFTS